MIKQRCLDSLGFVLLATVMVSCSFSNSEFLTASDCKGDSSCLEQTALLILEERCATCHGADGSKQAGIDYITDPDLLIQNGLVEPGSSSQSPLFNRMESGSMPPSEPVPTDEYELIAAWIDSLSTAQSGGSSSGGNSSGGNSGGSSGGGSSGGSSGGSNSGNSREISNFQARNILSSKCAICHGPDSRGLGGMDYVLDEVALIDNGAIIPGNATNSKIYKRVLSGSMPLGSAPLNNTELSQIAAWINAL